MSKLKKILLFIIVFSICPFLIHSLYAHDINLYMASGAGVEPNILIMFDNSGSMNEEIRAYFYDPAVTYPPDAVPTGNKNSVYHSYGESWSLWKDSINDVPCSNARTALTNQGFYSGYTNSRCDFLYYRLRTGNYRNYLASIGGDETLPKLTIAKKVITDLLDTLQGVRVGVMIFNNNEGGKIKSTIKSLDATTRAQLKNDINSIVAETWTPLAETLYEAGLYFKGGSSYFNTGVSYTSPIQYSCQKNYVIIITDGESTKDRNAILKNAVGDQNNDGREPGGANEVYYHSEGSDYLDDVANYLYNIDLRTDMSGQQNIITYTIGFTINSSLLGRTATYGHGKYFYCNNAQNLATVFQDIVNEILVKTCSFVAPTVPVSRMERTTAGDKVYLAFFKAASNKMWRGNLKKYGVAQTDSGDIKIGDILDANGNPALDSNGKFYPATRSYWTTSPLDGDEVEKGGAGEILFNRTASREIFTYLLTTKKIKDNDNKLDKLNSKLKPETFGLEQGDNDGKNKLIDFIYGLDSYDDDMDGNTTEKRDWILGSVIHSRPVFIHYGSRSVIFVGSNDGMLHAFDDSNGSELWAFIPPDLLPKLKSLHEDVVEFFVDGSPKPYIAYDANGAITKAIIILGERRGGNRYYALDVTNPLDPQFLWAIDPSTSGFSELGQTWSSPNIGKIAYGAGEKWVLFIGGGYDTNQDNDPVTVPDTKGRAVYVVDVLTGELVRRFSYSDAGYSSMTYSIPSDIAKVDINGDGKIDRLYVGDLGGRIWRFDLSDTSPTNWSGKIIFNSNPSSGDRRKIFYPPDVTLERDDVSYQRVFFGTGDREAPKETSVVNRIYSIKDKNPNTPLTETSLVDVTQDLLQSSGTSESQKATILRELKTKSGWFIKLDSNAGEKSLSTPITFNKVVYFTTFMPSTTGKAGDPCFVGEGTAKVYALQYETGNAAFNFDLTNDVGETKIISKTDREVTIGTAIPSGVIITFIKGKPVAFVGVGGRVFKPPITGTQLNNIYWRMVF
jgi:type IV pilus assembly protein PilY1